MRKKLLATVALTMFLTGCCIKHEFSDATCTSPRICNECGKTEGEALPHTFAEATCTAPKTCEECGMSEGEVLPHEYKEATCNTPMTCVNCGATKGSVADHRWEVNYEQDVKICSLCDIKENPMCVWKEREPLTCMTIADGEFYFSPNVEHSETFEPMEIGKPYCFGEEYTFSYETYYQGDNYIAFKDEDGMIHMMDKEDAVILSTEDGKRVYIPETGYNKDAAKTVFEKTNEVRVKNGLQELVWSDALYVTAQIRAYEITKLMAHTRPDNSPWNTLWCLLNGENLSRGYSKNEVVNAWMNSPLHKENILNGMYESGAIAVYSYNGTTYIAQHFSLGEYF